MNLNMRQPTLLKMRITLLMVFNVGLMVDVESTSRCSNNDYPASTDSQKDVGKKFCAALLQIENTYQKVGFPSSNPYNICKQKYEDVVNNNVKTDTKHGGIKFVDKFCTIKDLECINLYKPFHQSLCLGLETTVQYCADFEATVKNKKCMDSTTLLVQADIKYNNWWEGHRNNWVVTHFHCMEYFIVKHEKQTESLKDLNRWIKATSQTVEHLDNVCVVIFIYPVILNENEETRDKIYSVLIESFKSIQGVEKPKNNICSNDQYADIAKYLVDSKSYQNFKDASLLRTICQLDYELRFIENVLNSYSFVDGLQLLQHALKNNMTYKVFQDIYNYAQSIDKSLKFMVDLMYIVIVRSEFVNTTKNKQQVYFSQIFLPVLEYLTLE